MVKIPTAEEFLDRPEFEPEKGISFNDYHHGSIADSIPRILREFAKLHIKAALEAAKKAAEDHVHPAYKDGTLAKEISTSILNAYPENLIK